MRSLAYLLNSPSAWKEFLTSESVSQLSYKNKFVYESVMAMLDHPESLKEKCEKIKLGGYIVSGTTYMLSLLASAKGPQMAIARLEEMQITALGVLGNKCECLINRNAIQYLEGDILH